MIANARLSARSAAGYAKLGKFVRRLLRRGTLIAAQMKKMVHVLWRWAQKIIR